MERVNTEGIISKVEDGLSKVSREVNVIFFLVRQQRPA